MVASVCWKTLEKSDCGRRRWCEGVEGRGGLAMGAREELLECMLVALSGKNMLGSGTEGAGGLVPGAWSGAWCLPLAIREASTLDCTALAWL